jgi:TonB family protein
MSQRKDKAADVSGGFSEWLLHRAARSAPPALSQRLEEEWMADLATRPSGWSRLRFAIGCCWATRVIAYQHYAPTLAPSSAVAGTPLLAGDGRRGSGLLSRRTMTFLLVVCLHVVFFYVLIAKLSQTMVPAVMPPLQNRAVTEPKLQDLPPPPKPRLVDPRQLDLTPPDTHLAIELDPKTIIQPEIGPEIDPGLQSPDQLKTASLPPAEHATQEVQGGPGAGFPNPDDFYPSFSRYKEEQGVAMVRVCVDEKGRLTADPTTVEGTGYPQLDQGALKLARAGSGHYRPSTENGRPVKSCYPLRIRFQLKN